MHGFLTSLRVFNYLYLLFTYRLLIDKLKRLYNLATSSVQSHTECRKCIERSSSWCECISPRPFSLKAAASQNPRIARKLHNKHLTLLQRLCLPPTDSRRDGIDHPNPIKSSYITMSSSILHPPAHLSPAIALNLSQQAPGLLATKPSSISPYSISSLFTAVETPELWTTYENLLFSCLRTGDEQSAHLCLERLQERFDGTNERLMAFRGLFKEAIAQSDADLEHVLGEYDAILAADSGNTVCTKRPTTRTFQLTKHSR